MISATKSISNFYELKAKNLSAQKHCCLPWNSEKLSTCLRSQPFLAYSPFVSNSFLNSSYG